jgi:hypothetical protein
MNKTIGVQVLERREWLNTAKWADSRVLLRTTVRNYSRLGNDMRMTINRHTRINTATVDAAMKG